MESDQRPFRDELGAAFDRAAHLQEENARIREQLAQSRTPRARQASPPNRLLVVAMVIGGVGIAMGGAVAATRHRHRPVPAPTQAPPSTTDDVTRLPCAVSRSLRSETSKEPLDIDFVNAGPGPLTVYWINFAGARVRYQVMPPGTSYTQPTYVTHPWIAIDVSGSCVDVIVPNRAGSHPRVIFGN